MIEKKISYEINIEKPSKTKPVKQGGVFNYLGKQKTVNAPVKWRSSKDHPIEHLSYITKDEEKILIDLNLYGSLKNGKPNRGPFGLPSLQGSGGGSGGDGGGGDGGGDSGGDSGPGDSGPGGSDDGSGHGGPGAGDSGPGGSDDGTGHGGPGPGSAGESTGDAPGTQGGTVGEAEAAAQADAQSITADNISTQAQADQEDAATAAAANAATSGIGSLARQAIQAYMTYSPIGMLSRAVSNVVGNISRGVTGPSDDTQETESVQTSAPSSPDGGGITTLPSYAPLYNTSTGDNTADAIRTRLENLLKVPTSQTVFQPQNVNQLSNYTLADLINLRRI